MVSFFLYFSHSPSICLRDFGFLSVLMFFVQTLVYGIENWLWTRPHQPSSDVSVESSPLAGSSSWDLGAQRRGPHGCGSRRGCCFSAAEGSQWHLQTEKLSHLIQTICGQCVQVIQLAEHFSCGILLSYHIQWDFRFLVVFFFFPFSPLMDVLSWKTPEADYDDCVWIICVFCCAKVPRWKCAPWLKNNFTKCAELPGFQRDAEAHRWHTKR